MWDDFDYSIKVGNLMHIGESESSLQVNCLEGKINIPAEAQYIVWQLLQEES